jgi:hypothetical protein
MEKVDSLSESVNPFTPESVTRRIGPFSEAVAPSEPEMGEADIVIGVGWVL